jgi:threonine aldolase
VISNSLLQKDFRYYMKHKGAMSAKGFILGMQFETLFRDRLYFQLAEHANQMASVLKDACAEAGFPFLTRPVSNQIFPVVDNKTIARLQKDFAFEIWEPADEEHQIIRLVTSWATREEQVQKLVEAIRNR